MRLGWKICNALEFKTWFPWKVITKIFSFTPMKFEPGYWYKLKEKDFGLSFQCHILHVTREKDAIYYKIDDGQKYKVNPDDDYHPEMDGWQVVKQSQVPLMRKASQVVITIECIDEDGDYFKFVKKGRAATRQVFKDFPAIDKGFHH